MLRIPFLLFIIAAIGLCATVADAAMTTTRATELGRSAALLEQGYTRAALIAEGERSVRAAWSRPASWHGGAAEASSWLYALGAGAQTPPDSRKLGQSQAAAVAAIHSDPVAPLAWARLAALSSAIGAEAVCSATDCLDRSWRASAMLPAQAACARLQIAAADTSLTWSAADPRVRAYVASGPGAFEAARCLQFLPQRDLFDVVMDIRRQNALAEAR